MLGRTAEGLLCLEDGDGRVVLDMDEAVSLPPEGPRLAGGSLTRPPLRADPRRGPLYRGLPGPRRWRVYGRGGPARDRDGAPAERKALRREVRPPPPSSAHRFADSNPAPLRSLYGHVDFLGVGATSLKDEVGLTDSALRPLCATQLT